MPRSRKTVPRYKPRGYYPSKPAIGKLVKLIGDAPGAQTKFARKNKISIGHLNNVIARRRQVSKRIMTIISRY